MPQSQVLTDYEIQETVCDIADDLEELQNQENDGRGVSCVRTLIVYLRRDDLGSARAVIFNEWDKIRNYPRIVSKIFELDIPMAHRGVGELVGNLKLDW